MKKISLYLSLALAGLFTTACNEDFEDWSQPQSFSEPAAISIPGFTATAVTSAVDLNGATEVKVLSFNDAALPENATIEGLRMAVAAVDGGADPVTIEGISSTEGTFSKGDLQQIVVDAYGPRPTARQLAAHVYADGVVNGQATLIDAGTINFAVIPEAPIIETAYYYVGEANGWGGQAYKLDNGGGDVYENPEFSVMVPAVGGDHWFKIMPASAYELGSIWESPSVVGVYTNGTSELEGNFIVGPNGDDTEGSGANSWCIKESENPALQYRITLNMLDGTYTITPFSFKAESAYYYVGATNGWSTSDQTYVLSNGGADPLENPVFTALVPAPFNEDGTRADNWFKIAPASAYDNKDAFWQLLIGAQNNGDTSLTGTYDTGDGKDHEPGAFNMPASDGADYYRISINVKEFTYEVTPITLSERFYVVGGIQGWSTSDKGFLFTPEAKNVLSYTTKWTGAWDLKIWDADTFGNWEAAYGCVVDGDNSPSGALLNSGANAISAPSAEYYTFTIDLNTMQYTWTKLDDQNPTEYESISLIGEFNGWGGDVDLTQVAPHNWHVVFTQETSGQLKYRANHDWAKNWGYGNDGDFNVGEAIDRIGTNGGGNIYVPAGTYDVYLNDITNSMMFVAQ